MQASMSFEMACAGFAGTGGLVFEIDVMTGPALLGLLVESEVSKQTPMPLCGSHADQSGHN